MEQSQSTPLISIVTPVYQGEKTLPQLVRRCRKVLESISSDFDIVLVDDGSPDDSWQAIEAECHADRRVKGVKLSRNFGQHCAITAGLAECRGQWIVVMDCDLQDRPEEIPRLWAEANAGHDLVFARRARRSDGVIKRLTSKIFYRVLGYLTETQQDPAVGNFGIYHRKVIDAVLAMNDQVKFFATMVKWVGFNSSAIDVEHDERADGDTTYSLKKLMDLAISVILSFSDKPLRLTVRLGLLISMTAVGFALYNIYLYFVGRITVLGFTSLIVSIWLLSGVMITLIGMLGLYVGRIFDQTKNRPTFIVDQLVNDLQGGERPGTVSFPTAEAPQRVAG